MIFSTIKVNIRENLNDAGITFFNETQLNNSVQDAYNDIAILTRCITKKQSAISWQGGLSYYKFRDIVPDYFWPLAIFNNASNMWLEDNTNIRQLDIIHWDWEKQNGTPRLWMPAGHERIAIFPKYSVISNETFDLIYAATAPTVVDEETPLIIESRQSLITLYCTGDILEQSEEFTKAEEYLVPYYIGVDEYMMQVKNLSGADLMRLA